MLITRFTLSVKGKKRGHLHPGGPASDRCSRHEALAGIRGTQAEPFYRMSSLRTPPFYGFWMGACLLTTEQGILCNAKAQVKKEDNSGVIENLYVCCDNAGGFFYNDYPCVIPGIAMGRNMTFAIKAVKVAFGED